MSALDFQGFPMPFFISEGGRLAARLNQGKTQERVLISSPPKAGTYLTASLLEALGLCSTGLHLMSGSVTDYRFATLEQAKNDPYSRSYEVSFRRILPLVLPGQFIVSHLDGDLNHRAECKGFKVIIPMRELRTTFVSHMRFYLDTARRTGGKELWVTLPPGPARTLRALNDLGPTHVRMCKNVLDWLEDTDAIPMRFEDIWGDRGTITQIATIQKLASHVGADIPQSKAVLKILARVLQQQNATWSGRRTKLSEWWNDAVEDKFRELGGTDLSSRIGYPDNWRKAAALGEWNAYAIAARQAPLTVAKRSRKKRANPLNQPSFTPDLLRTASALDEMREMVERSRSQRRNVETMIERLRMQHGNNK